MINQTEFAARPDVRPRQERPRFKAGAFFICTIASASWVCRALSHRACADRSVTVFVSITYPHGERLPGFSVMGVIVSEGKVAALSSEAAHAVRATYPMRDHPYPRPDHAAAEASGGPDEPATVPSAAV